jgi:hypothetical protein
MVFEVKIQKILVSTVNGLNGKYALVTCPKSFLIKVRLTYLAKPEIGPINRLCQWCVNLTF